MFIFNFLSWQTGAGTQESSEKDMRGSQPPRQKAPLPHWLYSVMQVSAVRICLTRRDVTKNGASRGTKTMQQKRGEPGKLHRECRSHGQNLREQQGVSSGHLLFTEQASGSAARTVEAPRRATTPSCSSEEIIVGGVDRSVRYYRSERRREDDRLESRRRVKWR